MFRTPGAHEKLAAAPAAAATTTAPAAAAATATATTTIYYKAHTDLPIPSLSLSLTFCCWGLYLPPEAKLEAKERAVDGRSPLARASELDLSG